MSDEVDKFIAFAEKRLARLPKEDRAESLAQIPRVKEMLEAAIGDPQRSAQARAFLRSAVDPVDVVMVGEHGKFLSESVDPDTRKDISRRHREANDMAKRLIGADSDPRMSPREWDAMCATQGIEALKGCAQPESAEGFIKSLLVQANSISDRNLSVMETLAGDDCALQSIRWSALWAKHGFPFVRVDNSRYAASLMTTSVPPDLASVIRAPWRAMRIAVPPGLLFLEWEGKREPCHRVWAMFDDANEWTIGCEGERAQIHMAGCSVEHLCEDVDVDKLTMTDAEGLALTGLDGRCLRVAARLVMGVCIGLDASEGPRRFQRKKIRGRRRGAKEPTVRVYRAGSPVKVDARVAVREYVIGQPRGKVKAPSVQVLVRGHWKNQRCGTGGKDRKFIHIEPYWRGPEEAPIAVRHHILNGEPEAAE